MHNRHPPQKVVCKLNQVSTSLHCGEAEYDCSLWKLFAPIRVDKTPWLLISCTTWSGINWESEVLLQLAVTLHILSLVETREIEDL